MSRKPSPKQQAVLHYLREHQTIDRLAAVQLIGKDIYTNEKFHVGNILSNMVERGMIERTKRGTYALPSGQDQPALPIHSSGCKWCQGKGCLVCS